jgi:tRNA(Ile)-lysidine synthase
MRVRSSVRPVLRRVAAGTFGSNDSVSNVRSNAQGEDRQPLVLVALSGGADSLALAAALAAEGPGAGVRAGAVIIDHGLQSGSAAVASRAAEQARDLGLDPVVVRRVVVGDGDGPEAAARAARYEALAATASELGCGVVLTAHTRDDQAEQVLLALARGSGTRSIAGIPLQREIVPGVFVARPLLTEQYEVTRAVTEASCAELALAPWRDPHNADPTYTRVRVRTTVLPMLERELGWGFGAALARSADLAREDADALDAIAEAHLGALMSGGGEDQPVRLSIEALRALPAALLGRVIRLVAARVFDSQLTREHTLAIASLVTGWKGQGPIHAPGIVVKREAGELVFCSRELLQ